MSLNELYLVLMYFLWSWVMFVLGPVVFNSDEKNQNILNWAITGTILIFLIGLFWGLFIGIDMAQAFGGSRAGAERYSFGFRNVGYIGSILVSIVAGAMLLYVFSTNKQMRVIWVVTVILFLIAMVMTDSRSYMVFIAIVWFVYITLNSRHAPLVIYIGVFGLIAIFIWFDRTFLIAENPIQQINYYSSGRIFIWEATIRNTMSSMTTIFLGHGIAQGWTTTLLTISGDTIIKPFQRFAVDNIFIELFSLYGLIGLILFCGRYFVLLK
ncbi:MAG: hypothetical protein M5U34_11000 [Chloroflexi bacterium]|nr:hypothetical protein [Chloroflexota bacterium]